MDTMTRMQTAGYRIEEDAAMADLGPGVELRANGLNQFLESCRSQNLIRCTCWYRCSKKIKQQPAVQSAVAAQAGSRNSI